MEKQLKEEKKRLKTEAKESYKKLVVSHRPIPEVENFLVEEQENDDVKVKIEEMSYNTIADENNWIGPNRPSTYDEEDGNDSVCEEEEVELPGMELRQTSKKVAEHGKHTAPAVSKKDVKRILKKQATKNMQKSKVFQQKSAVERIKQKKSALQQKKLKMMQQKKHGKVRHRK